MKFFEVKKSNGKIYLNSSVFLNPQKIAVIEQDDTKKDSCAVLLEGLTRPIFIPLSARELVDKIEEQIHEYSGND